MVVSTELSASFSVLHAAVMPALPLECATFRTQSITQHHCNLLTWYFSYSLTSTSQCHSSWHAMSTDPSSMHGTPRLTRIKEPDMLHMDKPQHTLAPPLCILFNGEDRPPGEADTLYTVLLQIHTASALLCYCAMWPCFWRCCLSLAE